MTREAESFNGKPSIPDNEIIDRFGGIRPMASKLGVAVTTVQGWKERGHIPKGRYAQIVEAAARHGVDIGLAKPPAPELAKTEPEERVEPERAKDETIAAKGPEPAPVSDPEPTPAPEPAPARAEEIRVATTAPAAPTRVRGGVSWVALIIAVLLLGGAILTGPLWQSKLYPGRGIGVGPVDAGRLAEIADSLSAIEGSIQDLRRDLDGARDGLSGRINALEAGGGETGAAFAEQLAAIENSLKTLDAGLSGIESRIAGLEADRDKLPDSVKNSLDAADATLQELKREVEEQGRNFLEGVASLGNNLASLQARVTTLESRPVQTGERIAAMALALGQVEAAMNAGTPFRKALDRLELLGREDPVISESGAVATLSPWADHGISDRLILRSRFAELAPDIDRALSGAEEGNWLDNVWNSITGLVTVRRIDGSDPSPIAQAERALERGDLEGVATAFEGKGSLGPDGDTWLILVQARIDAEREIDALYGQIILPLAGRSDGSAAQ